MITDLQIEDPAADFCEYVTQLHDPPNLHCARSVAAHFVSYFGLVPPLQNSEALRFADYLAQAGVNRAMIDERGLNVSYGRGHRAVSSIAYSDRETPQSANMTIFHEIAELILDRLGRLGARPIFRSKDRMERWATEFASFILAPPDLFARTLVTYRFDPILVMHRFDVSLPATLVRIGKLLPKGVPYFTAIYGISDAMSDWKQVIPFWGYCTGIKSSNEDPTEWRTVRRLVLRAVEEDTDLVHQYLGPLTPPGGSGNHTEISMEFAVHLTERRGFLYRAAVVGMSAAARDELEDLHGPPGRL